MTLPGSSISVYHGMSVVLNPPVSAEKQKANRIPNTTTVNKRKPMAWFFLVRVFEEEEDFEEVEERVVVVVVVVEVVREGVVDEGVVALTTGTVVGTPGTIVTSILGSYRVTPCKGHTGNRSKKNLPNPELLFFEKST